MFFFISIEEKSKLHGRDLRNWTLKFGKVLVLSSINLVSKLVDPASRLSTVGVLSLFIHLPQTPSPSTSSTFSWFLDYWWDYYHSLSCSTTFHWFERALGSCSNFKCTKAT